jgi:hypothetical protein
LSLLDDLQVESFPLAEILSELARARPVFHSEADFQHAFAWTIHKRLPSAEVRLEVPLSGGVIDVLLSQGAVRIGVELKFGRGPLSCEVAGERFVLREHPLPVVRDEFWKDVQRLEIWARQGAIGAGIAVCLANHDGCWKPPSRATTQDAIRFHDGLRAPRTMKLDPRPRSAKEFPSILLGEEYDCAWRPYSRLGDSRFAEFRYLAIAVRDPKPVQL